MIHLKKVLLSTILLILVSNSTSATNQYLDVFSSSGTNTLVLFRVKPGANDILNPTIIIYTSETSEVFIGGVLLINGTGKLILNITASQRVNIYSEYKNLTFWAQKITDAPIYEQANFISEGMIDVAFNSGVIQSLIGSFILGPTIALVVRRHRLE